MAVPGPPFLLVTGTPANPQFAEVVLGGHTVEANASIKQVVNVFHFRRRPSAIAANALSLVNQFVAIMTGDLNTALNVTYVSDFISGRLMDDPTVLPTVVGGSLIPARTGDRLPSFNAVTVQIKTNGRGRNYRGSKHYAPLSEDDTTLDNLTGTGATNWGAVATTMANSLNALVDANGNTWDLVVLSQELSDLSANPSVFTGAYMTDCILNLQVGSMLRRRQRKPV